MDAQHQKTNKSAQFACYLREHTSSSSITSYIYLFALLFPPLIHLFPLYSAFKQDYRASKQASNKERAKFLGTTFFFFLFFWSRRQKATTRTTYLTLPYLPRYKPANREPPNCELRLGNQTTMCDYTKVEYACYHLRYTVRAWCKSTYFSGHPFFLFLFPFPFFFLHFAHISQCPRHGWRFWYVCF